MVANSFDHYLAEYGWWNESLIMYWCVGHTIWSPFCGVSAAIYTGRLGYLLIHLLLSLI